VDAVFKYCRSVVVVSVLNPAVWVCAALGLLLYTDNWYEWLFVAFSIGYSNHLILQALAYRNYLNNAKAASDALRTAAESYDISITSLIELIDRWQIESIDLLAQFIFVCRLRAKPGVKPITGFKSYIMSTYSLLFISANRELTTFDRFYMLHEASHSTGTAEALHHNMFSVGVRSLPIYLPLYLLANNWMVGIFIVLTHLLDSAGNPTLMTEALKTTLCDHAAANYRTLTTMAAQLLMVAAERQLPQLDEKLYFEIFRFGERPRRCCVPCEISHACTGFAYDWFVWSI
jgi:hypothetical protein